MKFQCPICNQSNETKYCGHCGTLSTGRRLVLKDVFTGIADSVFNLDNAFIRTFVELLRNPYKVVQSYWNGYRKYFIDPFRFFLAAILLLGLKIYFGGENLFFFSIGGQSSVSQEWLDLCSRIFITYFLSLIVFRKLKATGLEHLVATIYVVSFISILEFPIAIFLKWVHISWIENIIKLCFTIYMFYSLAKAYNPSTNQKGIKNSTISYIVILVALIIALGCLVFLFKENFYFQ